MQTKLQKTGYTVTRDDGTPYELDGHSYFTKAIARDIAYVVRGMYHDADRTTIKEVVVAL